jgi:hypothetical protein
VGRSIFGKIFCRSEKNVYLVLKSAVGREIKTKATRAAVRATTAEPKNRNAFSASRASPKVGGPIATPKNLTVPYKQVIIPRRSVLVAPVISELMGGRMIPILIPARKSKPR